MLLAKLPKGVSVRVEHEDRAEGNGTIKVVIVDGPKGPVRVTLPSNQSPSQYAAIVKADQSKLPFPYNH